MVDGKNSDEKYFLCNLAYESKTEYISKQRKNEWKMTTEIRQQLKTNVTHTKKKLEQE